ncbi:MAG TPA: hypothetical protein VF445_02440 [Bordetella sp.]|uniref:hypothetical protein n=1 Tax=Bordetella sp. TaxID=28081 RepID=UPI002ED1D6A5
MSKRNTSKNDKTSFTEFAKQFDKNQYYTPADVGRLNRVTVPFTRTDGEPDNDDEHIVTAFKYEGLRPEAAVVTIMRNANTRELQRQLAVFVRIPKVRGGREHVSTYEWRMGKWHDKVGRALKALRCGEATISGAGVSI